MPSRYHGVMTSLKGSNECFIIYTNRKYIIYKEFGYMAIYFLKSIRSEEENSNKSTNKQNEKTTYIYTKTYK